MHRQTLTLSYTCPLYASRFNIQPALIRTTAGHISSIHGIPWLKPAIGGVLGFAWFWIHDWTWWNQQFSIDNVRQPTSCAVVFSWPPIWENKLRAQVRTSLWSGIAIFERGGETYHISRQNVHVGSPFSCKISIYDVSGSIIYHISKGRRMDKGPPTSRVRDVWKNPRIKHKVQSGIINNMKWGWVKHGKAIPSYQPAYPPNWQRIHT